MQNPPKSNARIEPLVTILLLVIIAAVAYLPLVSQLGYYHDDWHSINSEVSGVSFSSMFSIDRPLMGIIYGITHSILGDRPLYWQLDAFLLKVLGTLAFLWILRLIWPQQRLVTAAMALIYLVYPGFLQMPSANTYQNLLLCVLLGLLSIALALKAVLTQRLWIKAPLILAALACELAYMGMFEYMVGIEGMRLLLMGYVIWRREEGRNLKSRVLSIGLNWLPYLGLFAGFLYWRIFVFSSSRPSTNVGSLLAGYASRPIYMLAKVAFESAKDFLESTILAWFVPFYNLISVAQLTDFLISVGLAILGVGLVLGYVAWMRRQRDSGHEAVQRYREEAPGNRWLLDAIWLGAISSVMLILPVIVSGRDVEFSTSFDRYTLHVIPGVAMLIVAFFFYFARDALKIGAVAFLIGIAIVTHYNNAAYFRDFWNYERQLWWQLSWRAPQVEAGTVLMPVLPAAYHLGEDFEIWGPANYIYSSPHGPLEIVAEVLNQDTAQKVMWGLEDVRSYRNINFTRDFRNTLIVTLPGPASCLHVLDGNAVELPENDDPLVALVAKYSQIDRIDVTDPPKVPPESVFGKEPAHNWCYYYQKMELARQKGDWKQVADLADEASRQGLRPTDISEWLPVFEAYANNHRYDEANSIARIMRSDRAVHLEYCEGFDPGDAGVSPETADFMRVSLCTGK